MDAVLRGDVAQGMTQKTQLPKMSSPPAGAPATVLVGVRLDCRSRELLTWALVKVAQPGDRVVALHVLNHHENINSATKSSLLSLVKAFDSVLEVYEGFCDLKQVDLKVKIRRGSSVKKVLVSEARIYSSCTLVLGASQRSHIIRSSSSLAKYCCRKLPKSCCVLAVSNGKIKFQNGSTLSDGINNAQGKTEKLIHMFHRSPSKRKTSGNLDGSSNNERDSGENSMAVVPWSEREALSLSASGNLKLGWPLLHGGILSKQLFMLKWAIPLPCGRNLIQHKDDMHELQRENCTIVPLDNQSRSFPPTIQEIVGFHEKYSSCCRFFEYKELMSATYNFSRENLIGEGGNSQVYRGSLLDGREIAVKVMQSSRHVLQEVVSEIDIVSRIAHKNIVSLIGFCFENKECILVNDFIPRGSMEANLLRKGSNAFGWMERFKVAMGVAEALDFLHNNGAHSVIHGDVKAANILLGDDFEPQLSDFGLAKWAPTSSQIICSDVTGTFGYLAPEYFIYGKVNEKIDVYAFGVVLLELLTGQKAISNDCLKGTGSLVMQAKPILSSQKFSDLLDSSLGSDYNYNQVERMCLVASLCIHPEPWARPKMNIVLKLLQGEADATKCARLQVEDGLESSPRCNIEAHLRLAMLDLEDDSESTSSVEQ